jgi:hypothetical protein
LTVSSARAYPVQKIKKDTMARRLSNMFVIIAIENCNRSVFSIKKCYL